MQVIDVAANAIVVGLVGLVWWNIRSTMNRVEKKVETVADAHNACMADLPKNYASKDDAKKLFIEFENHERRISSFEGFLKGKFNGKTAQ